MSATAMPKPHKDRPITGMMAKWYAKNTSEMMKEYVELAHRIASDLPQGSRVLEVAPGPGYFCVELARRGSYAITGLDLSLSMVAMAQKNATAAGVSAQFLQGSASKMPLQSESFDFLLCRAAFKNFAQPVQALREMCRVLRPGGRGLIIDLKGNASPSELSAGVDAMGISGLNRVLTKLAFRTVLLRSAYTREQFQAMLAQTEFRSANVTENGIGLEIWMTK